MGRMCLLQLQVKFNSGSYVIIPTTMHFFQWANRTHSNLKVLKMRDYLLFNSLLSFFFNSSITVVILVTVKKISFLCSSVLFISISIFFHFLCNTSFFSNVLISVTLALKYNCFSWYQNFVFHLVSLNTF